MILDLRALSSVADYFVICTAMSSPQMSAIQGQLEEALQQMGVSLWHAEGMSAASAKAEGGKRSEAAPQQEVLWVLLDFGDIVVHVMDEPTRLFYQLERLWGDAPRVDLPPSPVNTPR